MTERQGQMLNIEAMIDRASVADILHIIADICHEKEDHIRANWQDNHYANEWKRTGRAVCVLANKTQV